MKSAYQASDIIQAHLIKNMLEQAGINSFIHGESLQGGIGDLQAFGFIQIMVNEQDYDEAKAIIADWETAKPIHQEE